MKSLKALVLLMPTLFVSQSRAVSPSEVLSCNYRLQQWALQHHNPLYGMGELSDSTKPLRSDSPERAMLMEPGDSPDCKTCSQMKDAAILVLDSGVFKVSYGDVERAKMRKGTDYISAHIADAGTDDLYVDFQDGPLMQAARSEISLNSVGVAVFWPQVNYTWKQLMVSGNKDFSSAKYVSIHAESISGTPEANRALGVISGLVKDGVKATIDGFARERDDVTNRSLNDLKIEITHLTNRSQRLAQGINETQQRIADAQSKIAPVQKDYDDLTAAQKGGSYAAPVEAAINRQRAADAAQLDALRAVIVEGKTAIFNFEAERVATAAALVSQTQALQVKQKIVDDLLASFKATGAVDCAETLPNP